MDELECYTEIEYSSNVLNNIRETIESMSKFNQIEILRILNSHKAVTINENKYGIHINLSELPNYIIAELQIYINYVNTQELELNKTEKEKESYKSTYFINDKCSKDNKDNTKSTVTTTYAR